MSGVRRRTSKVRGTCIICQREMNERVDGLIRRHHRGYYDLRACPGSELPSYEVVMRRANKDRNK